MASAFITFEGGEGVGKSTQASRLAGRLRARGREVLVTREPGGSPFAERVREALLSPAARDLDPLEQAMMFAAARADHVEVVIKPALSRGSVVICDRFVDSTEAYQGAAGAPVETLTALAGVAAGSLVPDLTLMLDCPPHLAAERLAQRGGSDRFEAAALDVQERRREAFLAIAAREPSRCVVVDASMPPGAIATEIDAILAARLPRLAG